MPRHLFRPLRQSRFALLLCAATALLQAHDPFEITTLAQLRPAILEIDVTMARSTALAIATGQVESATFEPADFEKYRAGFTTAAPGLFVLTADGRPLEVRSVTVSLGREQDVDFHLVYPAPAAGAR